MDSTGIGTTQSTSDIYSTTATTDTTAATTDTTATTTDTATTTTSTTDTHMITNTDQQHSTITNQTPTVDDDTDRSSMMMMMMMMDDYYNNIPDMNPRMIEDLPPAKRHKLATTDTDTVPRIIEFHFSGYLTHEDMSSDGDTAQILNSLALRMVSSTDQAQLVGHQYRPLIIDLAGRIVLQVHQQQQLQKQHPSFHEASMIISAMAVVLPTCPQILTHVKDILQLLRSTLRQALSTDQFSFDILLALYRLAMFNYTAFHPFYDWWHVPTLCTHTDDKVMCLAINIYALTTNMSDQQRMDMLSILSLDLQLLPLHESQRVVKCQEQLLTPHRPAQINFSVTTRDLCSLSVDICGMLMTRSVFDQALDQVSVDPLVLTHTTATSLRTIVASMSINAPVFMHGPPSSGKSHCITYLAQKLHKRLLTIHITDSTDAKTLLGNYVCTDVPGEFVFQMGVLAKAVNFGYWVLIEDVNLAPADVMTVLSSLIERSEVLLGGSSGEKLKCGPGFRLFATSTVNVSQDLEHTNVNGVSPSAWTFARVENLSDNELCQVITARFSQRFTDDMIRWIMKAYYVACDLMTQPNSTQSAMRACSVRDLIKWCIRINSRFTNTDAEVSGTSHDVRLMMFAEGVEVFFESMRSVELRSSFIHQFATTLQVSNEVCQNWISGRIPEIRAEESELKIGRVSIDRSRLPATLLRKSIERPFAVTVYSGRLMERLAACIHPDCAEPALLVGETGTGKTTVVQHLANMLNIKLNVINLSQQSDSTDLLGGYKPVDIRTHIFLPLRDTFDQIFASTFSVNENQKYLDACRKLWIKGAWKQLVSVWSMGVNMAKKRADFTTSSNFKAWSKFADRLASLTRQLESNTANGLMFSFVEGTLVKAIQSGEWILFDEINLASQETLECLTSLLQSSTGSILLADRGDDVQLKRHPSFRVFACMNPSNDVGKRDLPAGLRTRFTEYWVGSPDETISIRLSDLGISAEIDETCQGFKDVLMISSAYLQGMSIASDRVRLQVSHAVTRIYLHLTALARGHYFKSDSEGAVTKPHYSLRTLSRALHFASTLVTMFGSYRALYEGLYLSFCTTLNTDGKELAKSVVFQHLFYNNVPAFTNRDVLNLIKAEPKNASTDHKIVFGYTIPVGRHPLTPAAAYLLQNYVSTPSVHQNLSNLSRTLLSGYPVLLQGPTSAGKTSMIEYMAALTGNRFVRINNHEHTDLQEYIGSYSWSDAENRIKFQEGVLVQALRNGWWIVLDELNLAPTDVLEALNRLLDDNRELFIAETGETVTPAEGFMLFATQNPAGSVYGGRKFLSRAFRNRFVEVHFGSIPSDELEVILQSRCRIAPSYARKMVSVFSSLQKQRSKSRIFDAREGFMTLRDLFRWAGRKNDGGEQPIGDDGYMLLAERIRTPEERETVVNTLEKFLKCKIDVDTIYYSAQKPDAGLLPFPIVWTKAMKRLYALVCRALDHSEPVLLVGETGCGKTTVLQVFAAAHRQRIHIVNCHEHSEPADFIGSIRPKRSDDGKLFEWTNGPLVQAMLNGDVFVLDEISLAEDSVLERLNSVLEPSQLLVLAEKSAQGDVEEINGAPGFKICASMNPGGDFGKKELSPALRNRFTEIWVGAAWSDLNDVKLIINDRLEIMDTSLATAIILQFCEFFARNVLQTTVTDIWSGDEVLIGMRDILSWICFINDSKLPLEYSTYHGCCMTMIDSIGMNQNGFNRSASGQFEVASLKDSCTQFILNLVGLSAAVVTDFNFSLVPHLKIGPFEIESGTVQTETFDNFSFTTEGTRRNVFSVIRAMQISQKKPILLEGAPGVGKTSLVDAIAKASKHHLVRINLSEQTDIMDLFGSDVPVDGNSSQAAMFQWRNGPFLNAMVSGHWVLLDELNLANQSVLEGLNACFDHRASVYIPELDRTFTRHSEFRVFAAQNPIGQGGGRKGLPKSFLNRFVRVFVDVLSEEDLLKICTHSFPKMETATLSRMIKFNFLLYEKTMVDGAFGQIGKPWEFNLRDMFRWVSLLQSTPHTKPSDFLEIMYLHRMRTDADRKTVVELFEKVAESSYIPYQRQITWSMSASEFAIGTAVLSRNSISRTDIYNMRTTIFASTIHQLHSVAKCVEMRWMPILVGSAGCGKTSLVRFLANSTGRKLIEMPMNSSTDSADLIGGFEQASVGRHIQAFIVDLEQKAIDHVHRLGQFEVLEMLTTFKADPRSNLDTASLILNNLGGEQRLLDSLNTLKKMVSEELKAMGSFEWVDGSLVDAVVNGHWILIDNANLCSPSVLDRLNSLVESQTFFFVGERSRNSQDDVIVPHKNFRIFLSVDPSRGGELSRAMRNRGIEICFDALMAESQDDVLKACSQLGMSSRAFAAHFVCCRSNDTASLSRCVLEAALDIDSLQRDVNCSSSHLASELQISSSWPQEMSPTLLTNADMTSVALTVKSFDFLSNTCDTDMVLLALSTPKFSQDLIIRQLEISGADVASLEVVRRCILYCRDNITDVSDKDAMSSFVRKQPHGHIKLLINQVRFMLFACNFSKSLGVNALETSCQRQRIQSFTLAETLYCSSLKNSPKVFRDTEKSFLRGIWTQIVELIGEVTAVSVNDSTVCSWLHVLQLTLEEPYTQDFTRILSCLKRLPSIMFPRAALVAQKLAADQARLERFITLWSRSLSHHIRNNRKLFDQVVNLIDLRDGSTFYSSSEASLTEDTESLLDALSNTLELSFESSNHALSTELHDQIQQFVNRRRELAWSLFEKKRCQSLYNKFALILEHGFLASKSKSDIQLFYKIYGMSAMKLVDLVPLHKYLALHTEGDFLMSLRSWHERVWTYMEEGPRYLWDSSTLGFACNLISDASISSLDTIATMTTDLQEFVEFVVLSSQHNLTVDDKLSHGQISSIFFGDESVEKRDWVSFSLSLLRNYWPDVAYDPALDRQIDLSILKLNHRHLQEEVHCLEKIGLVWHGSESHWAIQDSCQRLVEISTEINTLDTTMPKRSEGSALVTLFSEVSNFIATLSQLDGISQSLSAEQEHVWQEKLHVFATRLQSNHPDLEDIYAPILLFVHFLRFGLRQMVYLSQLEASPFEKAMRTILDSGIFSVDASDPTLTTKMCAQELTGIICSSHPLDVVKLENVLAAVCSLWSDSLALKQREVEQQNSLYRTQEFVDEENTDVELLHADFRASDWSDSATSQLENGEPKTVDSCDEIFQHKIVQLHIEALDLKRMDDDRCLQRTNQMLCGKLDLISFMRKHSSQATSSRWDQELAPSMVLATSTLRTSLIREVDQIDNFYIDMNIAEVQRLHSLLVDMKSALKELLLRWPEHPTLLHILSVCERITKFPVNDSLMRFLIGAEMVLEKSQDWEAYASKDVSLNVPLGAISQLVLEWRKLEINSWSSMLDREHANYTASNDKFWLHLVQTLLSGNSVDDKSALMSIFQVVSEFINTCRLGDFTRRMELVKLFVKHTRCTRSRQPIAQLLANLLKYYGQFSDLLHETIVTLRAPIEEDLKKFIKLCSWRDVNYFALKQSVEKSHRQISKALRNFKKNVLEIPFATVAAQYHEQMSLKISTDSKIMLSPVAPFDSTFTAVILPVVESRISTLISFGGAAALLDKLNKILVHRNAADPLYDSDSHEHFESFTGEIIETIADHQQRGLDIGAATIENIGALKNLRKMKHNSLVRLLKSLRIAGLSWRLYADKTAQAFDACNQPFPNNDVIDLSKMDDYYGKSLARMEALRSAALQEISHQISTDQSQKIKGYCEHLFQLSINRREVTLILLDNFCSLSKYESFVAGEVHAISKSSTVMAGLLKYASASVLDCLHECSVVATAQNYIISRLAIEQIVLFRERLNNLGTFGDLVTVTIDDLRTEFLSLVTSAIGELESSLLVGKSQMIQRLKQISKTCVITEDLAVPSTVASPSGIDEHADEVIRHVLLSVQKLLAHKEKEKLELEVTLEEDGELPAHFVMKSHESLSAVTSALDVYGFCERLASLEGHLSAVETSELADYAVVVLNSLRPFVAQFFQLVRCHVLRYANHVRSLNKMTYVVCNVSILLFQKGFCLSEDLDDGDEESPDNGDAELEGTGIGEGHGKKDVSDQIEDEEQVTGLQNEDQPEERENTSEEKEGINMQNDFDGQMEDVDKELDKSDDSADNQSDMDDQMGDLERKGEDIDEKLWGDEDEERNLDEALQTGDDVKVLDAETEMAAKIGDDEDQAPDKDDHIQEDDQKKEENSAEQDFEETEEDQINQDAAAEESKGVEPRTADTAEEQTSAEEPDNDDGLPDEMKLDEADLDEKSKDDNNAMSDADLSELDENAEVDAATNTIDENPIFDPIQDDPSQIPEETPNDVNQSNISERDRIADESEDQQYGTIGIESNLAPDKNHDNDATMDSGENSGNHEFGDSADFQERAQDAQTQSQTPDRTQDTNADRSLSDSIEKWKRRVEAIDKQSHSEESATQNKQADSVDGSFEFVSEQEIGHDADTMAPANDEQLAVQPLNIHDPMDEDVDDKVDECAQKDIEIDKEENIDSGAGPRDHAPSKEKTLPFETQQSIEENESPEKPLDVSDDEEEERQLVNEFQTVQISPEAIDEAREYVAGIITVQRESSCTMTIEASREVWNQCEKVTYGLAMQLCEQLRLVLAPTKNTKLRGDYRTGKRLNMKKLVPYIASQFKKDKIWLRRSKPAKREYQVLLAIDDSKSMAETRSIQLTCESLALLAKGFSHLEVGQIGMMRFGETAELVHSFDTNFTSDRGAEIIQSFSFNQEKTRIPQLLEASLGYLREQRNNSSSKSRSELWQLQLIISDGLCENHVHIQRLLQEAYEAHILVVFIIVDKGRKEGTSSLLMTKNVSFVDGKLVMKEYMDSFPFSYHIVLRDIKGLPDVLSSALRQWMEAINDSSSQ